MHDSLQETIDTLKDAEDEAERRLEELEVTESHYDINITTTCISPPLHYISDYLSYFFCCIWSRCAESQKQQHPSREKRSRWWGRMGQNRKEKRDLGGLEVQDVL